MKLLTSNFSKKMVLVVFVPNRPARNQRKRAWSNRLNCVQSKCVRISRWLLDFVKLSCHQTIASGGKKLEVHFLSQIKESATDSYAFRLNTMQPLTPSYFSLISSWSIWHENDQHHFLRKVACKQLQWSFWMFQSILADDNSL